MDASASTGILASLHALPERAGSGFDTGGPAVFRWPMQRLPVCWKRLSSSSVTASLQPDHNEEDSSLLHRSDREGCRARPKHGRPEAQSGRDSAIRGRMDRSEGSTARGNMRWVPRPSVFRGNRSLTAAPHRSARCKAYRYKAGLIAFVGSWHGSSGASYYACLKKICPFKLLISRSCVYPCVRRLQNWPIAIYMKVLWSAELQSY